MKNLEQLIMVRALVKEERRQGRWDQSHWSQDLVWDSETESRKISCGSTACVAGWAAYMDGARFIDNDCVAAREGEPFESVSLYDNDGRFLRYEKATYVHKRAQSVLGLTQDEADELFDGENDWETVMRLLKKYIKQARKERRKIEKKADA